MNSNLNELKQKVNLLDYTIKKYDCKIVYKDKKFVRLNPCPICGKDDHFDIHTNTNSYFSQSGCCNGGTIIDFLIETKGITQGQAISELKEISGDYEEFKPNHIDPKEIDKKVYDFNPLIEKAKENISKTDYFRSRGFSDETIKRSNLGYFSTGLNYAIGKFPELFPSKKPNEYFKNFKYFIPCFDKDGNVPFFINRYADEEDVPTWVTDHIKVMNPKGSSPIPLNLKYLYEEFFKSEYIFICEGWADALSIEEIGYKAIALNSTSNHRILSKYLDEILNTELIKNKIFIICGDSDAAGNKLDIDLQKYFNKNKIPSNIFNLPEADGVKDMNDLLRKDRNQFIELINNFIDDIKDKEYVFAEETKINQYRSDDDYKNLFKDLFIYVKSPMFRTFEALKIIAIGLNNTKCKKSLSDDELNKLVKNIINKYSMPDYYTEKGKVIPLTLAKHIVDDKKVISDRLNTYMYKDGYYCEVDSFYKDITSLVNDPILITPKLVMDTAFHINQSTNQGTISNDRKYINFKNGLWNIKERNIIPHTSEITTLGQFNGNFDGTLKKIKGTKFEQFLNTSVDKELIPVIQEMIGVCLYPLTDKLHYFYILKGEGRNGKGILMDLILKIIPENFRSGISVKDYDTRFANSSIKGKTINICTDDKTTRLEGVGNLKSVTAGESIFVERKGVDGVMIQTYLTHISSFNALPSMQEKTNALFDRMIVIPFNKTFGDQEEVDGGQKDMLKDPNLKSDIINKELDIIISWGMEGLYRVIDNGYKFTKPKLITDKLEEYRNEVDSVRDWATQKLTPIAATSNSQYVKSSLLFNCYRKWCVEEGASEVGKKAFNESMYRLYKNYFKVIQRNNFYSVKFNN